MTPPGVETTAQSQVAPEEVQGDDNNSIDYACNECRRRKARCTRELPVCSLCKRHGRHCLYQRHSRTPLTRKHLTEVEEQLRIASRIIAQRLPDVDLDLEIQRSRNGESGSESNGPTDPKREDSLRVGGSKRQRSMSNHYAEEHVASEARHSDPIDSDLYATQIESLISPRESNNVSENTALSPEASLEHLSPNNLDYDWDERHNEAALGLDGMGGLSLHEEKPGYLGLASGAALLNLIQSYTSDPFASIQPVTHEPAGAGSRSTPGRGPVDLQRDIPNHNVAQYISDYFNTYHISYPLVHQGIFMAQYNEIIPRPKIGWMVLMYTIAAIGAFMAATTPKDDDLILFHLARSHLSVEMLEIGNLTLVQSLTLISNYLQKRDRPNSGYNYLGLAVRMAFGLGLHKELPNWKSNLLQTEIRRRVWWCLYIFDTGSTITYSRPLGIPSNGIDARLPLNTFDSDLNAGTTKLPPNVPAPTIYTNVRVQSQFHLLTNNLYNRIISKPFPSAKEVLSWDDLYIGKWLNQVPDFYQDDAVMPEQHALAHAIMVWRYKNLRMIIYRPFLIQKYCHLEAIHTTVRVPAPAIIAATVATGETGSSSRSDIALACDRCRKESNQTIRHIDQFWKAHSHTRMASWYALFFLFPAVLVPLMSLRNEPQSPFSNSWREDISTATQIITNMVELNPSAARCLRVLEKLCAGFFTDNLNQIQDPGLDENYMQQPIEESPITQMLSVRSMIFPDAPLYDVDDQILYDHRYFSALGTTSDELSAWTDEWNSSSNG